MLCLSFLLSLALPGCDLSDQSVRKAAMPGPDPLSKNGNPRPTDSKTAAQGPIPEAVSVTANTAPALPVDSPAQANGRRILSTAFVRVGPDGHLTVTLRNRSIIVLRDVVMRPKDYCGVPISSGAISGGKARARYCGSYDEVAAARPGRAPTSDEPDLTVPESVGKRPI